MSTGTIQSDCTSEQSSWWKTPDWAANDLPAETESYPLRPFRSFRVKHALSEGDFRWDSTPVGRWETLAKTLPAIVTFGSIVVERGTPHFKGPPLVECPQCKTKLSRGTATLTFRQAPSATQKQAVEAWVCSCGEFYVPGEIAREAYLRAFQRTPELPKGEREYQAFLRLLPELLATHRGKYVAVHDEQVVDSDANDVALILRVHAKVGYVPIHVGLVTDSQPLGRVPHYHEVRPQGNS